ncbi:unnamed protein product, partial [marine sediment metagenome]
EQSIYLDRKQRLKSLSGIGSIPDGYVIIFGDIPHWHIVEVELSSHPLHDHIVAQVGRFISGISNPSIQRGIVNAIDEEIARNDFLKLKLKKVIEPIETYRFLSDLISKQPILTIIIEKETEELREALNALRHPQIKVVEFQTFTREGVGIAVHAHLFERLYVPQVTPEQEALSAGDVVGFSGINQQNTNYHYIDIDMSIRSCFPADKVRFTLETTAGKIDTNIVGTSSSSPYIQRNLKKWFDAHPDLKTGDVVSFTVIEPMKKY